MRSFWITVSHDNPIQRQCVPGKKCRVFMITVEPLRVQCSTSDLRVFQLNRKTGGVLQCTNNRQKGSYVFRGKFIWEVLDR